jgi:hypothetical protein
MKGNIVADELTTEQKNIFMTGKNVILTQDFRQNQPIVFGRKGRLPKSIKQLNWKHQK